MYLVTNEELSLVNGGERLKLDAGAVGGFLLGVVASHYANKALDKLDKAVAKGYKEASKGWRETDAVYGHYSNR